MARSDREESLLHGLRMPMTTLLLATSGPHGEVGLAPEEGDDLRVRVLGEGAARGRGVLPATRDLLAQAGLAPADLAFVVVDLGPGSFTGVRVGVTAAKTLAWALSIPVTGISSLEALAAAAPPHREVLALRDAGRGRLYFERFGPERGGRRAVLDGPGRAPGPGGA
ncbi:MAG: tRNA (adenosine(37)-N6)-threonylcarbamoyltransferase complex dimerization subunit type 1 TsaB, partial [Planctomycetota bacterium]